MTTPDTAAAERSNEGWLTALRATGPEGETARGELRAVLVTALRRGLGARAGGQIDDFAQDATLRVLQGLDSFRGESRFVSWASSIAIRVAMSELRKARWKDVSLDTLVKARGEGAKPTDPSIRANAEQALAQARVLAALERAIHGALTERQRTVITAELRGVPQAVLAEELGANRNAIYKVGHDARKALLSALAAEGIDGCTLNWVFDTAEGEKR
jgi:RNA polymerase sigma-70 factor (ECF subfamily)